MIFPAAEEKRGLFQKPALGPAHVTPIAQVLAQPLIHTQTKVHEFFRSATIDIIFFS